MNFNVLLTHRQYFGVAPQKLRDSAARVLTRIAGLPPERARINVRHLRNDFGMDTIEATALADELVGAGLLTPRAESPGDYQVTSRLADVASARVVDPLPRARAREIVAEACALALQINAGWARIPLEIEAIAAYGDYMSRRPQLDALSFGVVVRTRPETRRAHWRMTTKGDGAKAIRSAFRELDPFVSAHLVTEQKSLPRPFSIVFRAD